ncbi:HEAT repeat domain-containing protein [Gordonia sp. DT30]|uniref:HEAT repeat domain-containing protein n=1 Tax=unclassified Gordonia (in: high G+C Gram-positive bacteria) TaxID=2657482 RepID=UPI003CF6CD4E
MLIGEVARRSGVSARMLRHYDRLGLVSPTGRSAGGYRQYAAGDLRRLFQVESLRTLGLSLPEVAAALDHPDATPAKMVDELIRRTRDRIAAEEVLLDRLERVAAVSPADWTDVLGVVTMLRDLRSSSGTRRIQAVLTSDDDVLPVAEVVKAALAEQDPNVFGTLAWSLARVGDAVLDPLVEGLAAPDAAVRARAVRVIAAIDSDRVEPILRSALADDAAAVRDHAAVELAERGSVAAIDALVEMVVAGRRDIEAAEALGLLAEDAHLADRIVADLKRPLFPGNPTSSDQVRLRITQALAEIPGGAARMLLADLANDPAYVVAMTATAILAAAGRSPR